MTKDLLSNLEEEVEWEDTPIPKDTAGTIFCFYGYNPHDDYLYLKTEDRSAMTVSFQRVFVNPEDRQYNTLLWQEQPKHNDAWEDLVMDLPMEAFKSG